MSHGQTASAFAKRVKWLFALALVTDPAHEFARRILAAERTASIGLRPILQIGDVSLHDVKRIPI